VSEELDHLRDASDRCVSLDTKFGIRDDLRRSQFKVFERETSTTRWWAEGSYPTRQSLETEFGGLTRRYTPWRLQGSASPGATAQFYGGRTPGSVQLRLSLGRVEVGAAEWLGLYDPQAAPFIGLAYRQVTFYAG
jgi:hypothetical protein